MAYEIDDLTLAAWVLARRGEQEIHEAMITCGEAGKHVDQAMAYTGAAVSLASRSPPMARAFIVTKQALSASVAGDRTTALGALAECWRAYEQAGAMEEPPWMKMYGWGHLRHEEARCYYHLGMGADAVRAAEDSMRVRTETRPRAFSLGVQAIGYIQADQDIERACAIGHELVRLADQLGSRRVTIRLGEVLQVLIPYQGQPDVEDLREAAIPVMGRRV